MSLSELVADIYYIENLEQDLIGQGAMGEVYRGLNIQTGQTVAVKVLKPELVSGNPELVERFVREGEALSRLNHPNIVQRFAASSQQNNQTNTTSYYLVMEHITGGSLRDLLESQGRLPVKQVLQIALELSDALSRAHHLNIIHRDLKPANVLLAADGTPRLTDFGIAHFAASPRLTQTGMMMGTIAYLSPEACQGGALDERTDIWAFGVMLFEMLVGELPFKGDILASTLTAILTQPLPDIRALRSDVPPAVVALVERMLERDVQQRLSSMRLVGAEIEAILKERPLTPKTPIPPYASLDTFPLTTQPVANPYRGLHAFREEDAHLFFGRETFSQHLLEIIPQQHFVAVMGPSGSGKSSVVYAGLIPQLRQEGNWLIAQCRPGQEPIYNLAKVLIETVEPEESRIAKLKKARELTKAFTSQEDPLPLTDYLNDILVDKETRLLLFIDQFEELYTLQSEQASQHRFLDILLQALPENKGDTHSSFNPYPNRFHLVLTLRADFLNQALGYRPFADALQSNDLKLGPMNRTELERVIVEPAATVGMVFETGLAARILNDVMGQPGNLPLLQFALTLLGDKQQGGLLTHAAYENIGRVEGALATHADGIYACLSEMEKAQAQHVFVQLVQPGAGTEDTRRQATRSELGENAWPVVQHLSAENVRLLVTTGDESGSQTVEVVHEALIQRWGQLRQWMNVDRTFRQWQERLRAAMRQWGSSQKDEGALLRGAPLGEAENWLQERTADLSEEEQDYIRAGIALREKEVEAREVQRQNELAQARKLAQEAEARRQAEEARAEEAEARRQVEERRAAEQSQAARRLRMGAAVLLVAFIAAVIATVLANVAQQNADASRTLAEAEATRADQNFLIATRNLATAVAAQSTSETNAELAVSGQATAVAAAEAEAIAFATAEADREIAEQQKRLAETLALAAQSAEALDRSPKVALLRAIEAVHHTQADGTVTTEAQAALYAALTVPRMESVFIAHTEHLQFSRFSPDGSLILTGGDDSLARLWDRTGRLVATLAGHRDHVVAAEFRSDGRRIITTSEDGTARLWDGDGNFLVVLEGHTDTVNVARFSLDGRLIVTASGDGTARLWDGEGEHLTTLTEHTAPVKTAAISPDGEQIITASEDGTARLWDAAGEFIMVLDGDMPEVGSVAFSPDGQLIVMAGDDSRALLWNREGEFLVALAGHSGRITSVEFSKDGRIVTASEDDTARLWTTDGQLIATLAGHTGAVLIAKFSPQGQIVTASEDDTARLWAGDGQLIATLAGHTDAVNWAEFSSDGQWIVTGSDDDVARLWKVEGSLLATLVGHENRVRTAVFSEDGRFLVTASDDETAIVWDLNDANVSPIILRGHTDVVNSASFSPDGQRIVTASDDRTARLWGSSGQLQATLSAHTGAVRFANFSPDGQRIVTASDDGTARLWDVNGRPMVTLTGHSDIVWSAHFSPDGQQIVTASSDNTARLWDADGQPVLTLTGHTNVVDSASFSADGRFVLTTSWDATVRLWPVENGEDGNVIVLAGHEGRVRGASMSANGRLIATAGDDSTVRLWDNSGQLLTTLSDHTEPVRAVTFSFDGSRIVTTSDDGTARLWDSHGQLLTILTGHTNGVLSASFRADDRRIATASADGTAQLWIVFPGDIDTMLTEATWRILPLMTTAECRLIFAVSDDCEEVEIRIRRLLDW